MSTYLDFRISKDQLMSLKPAIKPNAVMAIFAFVVIVSGGCSTQDDGATNGASKPNKQSTESSQLEASPS